MKTFTITKQNLVQWYFEDSYTEENDLIKEEFIDDTIKSLSSDGQYTITVEKVFEKVYQGSIPLNMLEEFKGTDTDLQVEDIRGEVQVKLIN